MNNQKFQAITACAFIHKDGRLLVAKRAETKQFLPGKYELLGGHIEFGETLQDGLRREIREEIHIAIIVGEPFHVFTYETTYRVARGCRGAGGDSGPIHTSRRRAMPGSEAVR